MIRHLQAVDYAARTKVFPGERVEHVTFNFTLENQIHRGGQYFNDKYVGTFIRHSSLVPPPLVSVRNLGVLRHVFLGQRSGVSPPSSASHHLTKGTSLGGGAEEEGKCLSPSWSSRFIGLRLKSVTFEDSLFEECYFEDVTSTNTFFRNCTFVNTVFYNTGKVEWLGLSDQNGGGVGCT